MTVHHLAIAEDMAHLIWFRAETCDRTGGDIIRIENKIFALQPKSNPNRGACATPKAA